MHKINKDLKQTQLSQIEEKRYKQLEKRLYDQVLDGELINRTVNEYYD